MRGLVLAASPALACGSVEALNDVDGPTVVQGGGETVSSTQEAKDFVQKPTRTFASCQALRDWDGVIKNENVIFPAGCTYEGQIKFASGDVTLDCRNSYIDGSPGGNTIVAPVASPRPGISNNRHERHAKYVSLDGTSYKPLIAGIVVAQAEAPSSGECVPDDPAVEDVTIRNCRIRGFYQGIRFERRYREERINGECERLSERDYYTGYVRGQSYTYDGESAFTREALYARAPKRVRIVDTHVQENGQAGIYVMPYSEHFSIEGTTMANNGSVGIYLSHETRYNSVLRSRVVFNGWGSNAMPIPYDLPDAGELVEKSREGMAIDSSAHNTISHNEIRDNYKGGILLYKNCGEGHSVAKPSTIRKQHSNFNLIIHNTITRHANRIGGTNVNSGYGIWLASRQGQEWNDLEGDFRHCRDPYTVLGGKAYNYDYARYNTIAHNRFEDNWGSVRVGDDFNQIVGNEFRGATKYDVWIGNKFRGDLGFPVRGTRIVRNVSYSTSSNTSKRTVVPEEGSGSHTFFLGEMYNHVGRVNSTALHCLNASDDAPFNVCDDLPDDRLPGIFWD